MLAKDTIALVLKRGFPLLNLRIRFYKAWTFIIYMKTYNCKMQVGGSDQWGNITTGLELIRKMAPEGSKAFGLTIPLVTKADGTKFGKTEGGAIWLDPEKTTPYEFYQFWINTADADVVKYLKFFTFLSHEEIEGLEESVENEPHLRKAQKALAEEMTRLIHGQDSLDQAIKISEALFSGEIQNLTAAEIKQGFKDVPSYEHTTGEDIGIVDLLMAAEIVSSKRQAREDVTNGAISINGQRVTETDYVVSEKDRIEGQFTVIRRGKKKYFLIKY